MRMIALSLSLAAVLLVSACGSDQSPIDDGGIVAGGPVSGSVEGQGFVLASGFARDLRSGGLAVDLFDYSADCGDTTSDLSVGAMGLSLIVADSRVPGTYVVTVISGDAVGATVTLWEDQNGSLFPRSFSMEGREIVLERVEIDRVEGRADLVRGGDTRLTGSFDVPRCPAP